jgi:hypothetical protein
MSILKTYKSAAAMAEHGAGAPRWAWIPVLMVGSLVALHSLWDSLDSTWAYTVIGPSLGLLFREFRVAARTQRDPIADVYVTG